MVICIHNVIIELQEQSEVTDVIPIFIKETRQRQYSQLV